MIHRLLSSLPLLLLLVGAPVRAEDERQRAEALLRAGNAQADRGDHEAALQSYREARRLFPSYKIDLNIGLTLEALGRAREALRELESFVRRADPERDAAKLEVARGKIDRLRRGLEQARTPAPSTAVAPSAPRARRLWTWVVGAAGLATLVVGIGFGAAALSDYDTWEKTNDPLVFDEKKQAVPRKALVANICYGVGGALSAGAIALFFLEPRLRAGRERPSRARVHPMLGGGAAGLVLGGEF